MSTATVLLPAGTILAQTWVDLGLLNDVLFQFENASRAWVTALQPIALATFGSLAALELAWTGVRSALSANSGVERLFEVLFRKTLFLGFLYWLIDVSPALMPLILGSFQKAGAIASGVDRLHPSSFLATGVSIATHYLDNINALGLLLDPFGALMAVFGALLIVLAFAMMAGTMMLGLIESLLAIGAIPFLLAAAGSRWTASLAESSLAYIVRIGVKLFVLYLVAGVIDGLTVEWANRLNQTGMGPLGPVSFLGFLGSAFTLAMIVWSVPRYAANLVPNHLSFGLTPAVGDN